MLWAPRQLETNYYGVSFDVKTWLLNNQHGQHWWVPYVISGTKDYFRWFDMFLMCDNDTYLYYDIYFDNILYSFVLYVLLSVFPRHWAMRSMTFCTCSQRNKSNWWLFFLSELYHSFHFGSTSHHFLLTWNSAVAFAQSLEFSSQPQSVRCKKTYIRFWNDWLTHTPSYVVIAYWGSISKPACQLTQGNMSVHLQSHLLPICSWSPLPVCSMSLYNWQKLNYDNEQVVLLLCNKN